MRVLTRADNPALMAGFDRDGRFGSKVAVGPKWDKSGFFFRSDFSAFDAPAPNALKSDLKKPRICPIWGQSDPLWSQSYHS